MNNPEALTAPEPDEQPTDRVAVPAARPAPFRRPAVRGLIAAIVMLLVAGGGWLVWPVQVATTAASTGGEIFLEPADAAGRDPFSGTVVVGPQPPVAANKPAASSDGGIPSIPGDAPALYGGSRNEQTCDKAQLVTFLTNNPEKAAAWADALGIDPSRVAAYVAELTPMRLRADTRVTNHGYRDGRAIPRQSVLQAGTAVLVDGTGSPRVKCGCGNPLADPVPTAANSRFEGPTWREFSARGIAVVTAAQRLIDQFVILDVVTGETFYRPRGTDGAFDTPTVVPVVAPVPSTPAPRVVECPTGQQRERGSCVPIPPEPCPDGRERVGGECTAPPPAPLTCPEGSRPNAAGTECIDDPPPPPPCPEGTEPTSDGCLPVPPPCPPGTSGIYPDCEPVPCPPGTVGSPPDDCGPCPPGFELVYDGEQSICVGAPQPCPDGLPRNPQGECQQARRRSGPPRPS